MAQVVIGSADEALRGLLGSTLVEAGYSVAFAPSWTHLVERLARSSTRLVIVDGRLSGMAGRGMMLHDIASTLDHDPFVCALGDDLPPLPEIPRQPVRFRREVARMVGPVVPSQERNLLRWMGLGPRPLIVLAGLARSSLPIYIQGERGTGKKRVAQALHRLSGGGTFLSINASAGPVLPWRDGSGEDSSGLLYLGVGDVWPGDLVSSAMDRRMESGFRLVVGSRIAPPAGFGPWTHVVIPPLRERPTDLRALALHYLEVHRSAMGLPRRRFGRTLWSMILSHRWPGNARELESFVASVLVSVNRPVIHARDLPSSVRVLVESMSDRDPLWMSSSFEGMVESHLRRVVGLFEPDGGTSLFDMVMAGAERPLLRLALARTSGNQKSASRLLGISRNTLRTHMDRLGLGMSGASEESSDEG